MESGSEESNTLLVTKIPSSVDEEYITWYFERKKNFGGLHVENVQYNEKDACAIVEFASSKDIEAVLEKAPFKMKGSEVNVEIYRPEPEIQIDACCVQVSGPVEIVSDTETLEYYFESKRAGGGDIADIVFDEDLQMTRILFEREEDAQRVINKRTHTFQNQKLIVEQYIPGNTQSFTNNPTDQASKDEDSKDAKQEVINTVKVSGVIPSIKSTVMLYFENTKRSGGGDIETTWSDSETENVIYIKFVNENDAQNVLERSHVVKGKQLTVEPYLANKVSNTEPIEEKQTTPESTDDKASTGCDTVKVTGVVPSIRGTLELYFENSRRSGGGEYESIWSDEEDDGVIYIKYKTEEVARNVASKRHIVEGSQLKVTLYSPPKPPPCYDDKIIIKGLNETTSEDGLFNFIEAKSGFIPESMDNHETEPGVAMVTFQSKPDIKKLDSIFKAFKLEGKTLKISPVPISNCIMVSELPELVTKDSMWFYFENTRRSGGGDVVKVVMNEDDTCLVYFADYKVIDNVLNRTHTINEQTITVQRYQECLGRPEGGVVNRKLKIPQPVVLTNIDKDIVKYLQKSEIAKNDLEKQMEAFHAIIKWQEQDGDIQLQCTLTQGVVDCYKLSKTWKTDVLAGVNAFIENIIVEKITIVRGAWQGVLQRLQDVTIENPESIALFVDSKIYSITIVGVKGPVCALKVTLDSLVKKVMESVEPQKLVFKKSR